MDVCIYLRKSRAEENLSVGEVLKRHRATLTSYAMDKGYTVKSIKEEIVSGESITRRPKMLELLREIEENIYDGVLVMDMDRLGRGNMREQGLILETLKDYNTLIITPNKIYNLQDEFDEEFSEFQAFMARRELKIIKKRLARGRIKSLEEGNYLSPYAPFGYDKQDKTLIVNPIEAKVVEIIFELYIEMGFGVSRIASYLTSKGITNKHGLVSWDKSTINKIIQNPIYIGQISWGKRSYSYGDDGRRISKLKDKSSWLIYEGNHPPIIDKERFHSAQRISKERYVPHINNRSTLRNPVAGILKCGICGATMTLRSTKGRPDSLRCYKSCGNKSSYIHLIENALLSMILSEIDSMGYIYSYDNNIDVKKNVNILNKTIEIRKKELSNLIGQKNRLYDLLEMGIYDAETYNFRSQTIEKKLDATERDIKALLSQVATTKHVALAEGEKNLKIHNFRGFTGNLYNSLNISQKNALFKTLIHEVIYTKDRDAVKDDFTLDIRLRL